MSLTQWIQERRMNKFTDVLSRVELKHLSQLEAAEILGMSERTFRRYLRRYEDQGLEGLFDRRLGCSAVAPGRSRYLLAVQSKYDTLYFKVSEQLML